MPSRPRAAPDAPAESDPASVILPSIESDPFSYLGPSSTVVEFLGQEWTIPPLMAADWLEIIWAEQMDISEIFPGFVPGVDLEDLLADAMLDDDEFDPTEISDIAMEMLSLASGYEWWFTLRLCTTVKVSWFRVGGMLVLAGVDAREVTLGSWCSAVLALLSDHLQPKDYARMLDELSQPPAGHERDDEDQMVMDEREFMSAMAAPY